MVFEWLHMPGENGYNRMRHLSRTPPEFWSRHDRYHAGRERSKYFRARNKEYRRHGGTMMPEAAHRRFHAAFPGGEGYYFPYASRLQSPGRERFEEVVDARRNGYRFRGEFLAGAYGDPAALLGAAWRLAGIDGRDPERLELLMDFVEVYTGGFGGGVEGPLGWRFRGDRPNQIADADVGDPWWFNRNGRPNGPVYSPGGPGWLGPPGRWGEF